jgi:galactokinase
MTSEADAAALFESRFGAKTKLLLRAPGRANLIGEHTDYSMLPVLPMAINLGLNRASKP